MKHLRNSHVTAGFVRERTSPRVDRERRYTAVKMRGAEASLQALIQSSVHPPASYTESEMPSDTLLPFSSFLPSFGREHTTAGPVPPLLPSSSFWTLPHPVLEGLGDRGVAGEGCTTTTTAAVTATPAAAATSIFTTTATSNLPDTFSTLGVSSAFAGVSNRCGDLTTEQLEKARLRQIKADLRKQRNKEAARRSNLNKKLMRDQLEKKSVELWEENLQLHQDIRNLSNRLRHFRYMRKVMQHVCHAPSTLTACH